MSKEEKRSDGAELLPGTSSRLGKEAKIGVAVIAVLTIVFGVVLTVRLMGSSSDEKVVVTTTADAGKEKPGHEGKLDVLPKVTQTRPFSSSSSPTIVTAKAATAKPKMTGDLDAWKIASDPGETPRKRNGRHGASLDAPPSFMPEPPKPQTNRYDRYALDPPTTESAADAQVSNGMDGHARLMAPEPEMSARHARRGARCDDQDGFAVADSTSGPSNNRGGSRYANPTSRNDSPYTNRHEYSPPVRSIAQSDLGDYRRELPSRRFGGDLRRSTSASSANHAPVPQRDDGKYEVQPNDSYWAISERLYGTGAYFKALARHNRGQETGDERLQPGKLIMAPPVAELEKSYADLCPKPSHREALQSQSQVSTASTRNQLRGGRTYTVVEGDTLFNIARYELGKASRWAELYDWNRDVLGKDFNYLKPGTQLAMPDDAQSDVLAQPPSNTYRR